MSKGNGDTAKRIIKIPKPVLINIEKLIPNPQNLKDHSKSQVETLTKLIKLVGFKDPIVIDKKFNIKAGHGRLLAAKKLEMKKVPCIYIENLTKKQMDLFMYLDNYVNESPWITDNVELIFDDMPKMELEEWPEINWDDIIPQTEIVEGPIPELPKNPKTKFGNIYQLGNHRVMCGDSLDKKSISKLLGNSKIDLHLTDPPYNIGFKYNKHNDKQKDFEYHKFLTDWYSTIQNTNLIITPGPQNLKFWLNLKEPNDIGIWLKRNSRSGASAFYFRRCEPILFYGKFNKRTDDVFDYSMENYGELKKIELESGVGESHAPAKPIKFWNELITNYTEKQAIIFDSFLGTGTTLIASEQSNRICYGVELDPAYVDVIVERWQNLTGKKAKLLKNV